MNARQHITGILKEWLELTRLESHVIQVGRWSELAKIQKAKAMLRHPLVEAVEQWNVESPNEAASSPTRADLNRLLDLESHNSELLAVRKREVREKILILEQALDDFRRLRSCYAQKSEAA